MTARQVAPMIVLMDGVGLYSRLYLMDFVGFDSRAVGMLALDLVLAVLCGWQLLKLRRRGPGLGLTLAIGVATLISLSMGWLPMGTETGVSQFDSFWFGLGGIATFVRLSWLALYVGVCLWAVQPHSPIRAGEMGRGQARFRLE